MTTQPDEAAVCTAPAVLVADDPAEVFRRLSARHVQAAYRLAWAILGDEGDAEDAAQDAFTVAWRQRFSLREVERFDAWFGRILVNCWIRDSSSPTERFEGPPEKRPFGCLRQEYN